jgi:hypothetical protein
MNTIKIALIIILLSITSGCSYNTYTSGVGSAEAISYLYFSGEIKGALVTIDDLPSFLVTKAGIKNLYKVSPGKHVIIITKNEKVVVKRKILLGDGHEKEINIP